MSGLKWIEPALPIMYAISGYRAGIGYRNGEHKQYFFVNICNDFTEEVLLNYKNMEYSRQDDI